MLLLLAMREVIVRGIGAPMPAAIGLDEKGDMMTGTSEGVRHWLVKRR